MYMKYWRLFTFGMFAVLAGSCIRADLEPCPPLTFTLDVQDKNYFNVDEAARYGLVQAKDENLPFRDYVSTVYCALYNAETGEMVCEQKNREVNGDASTETVAFPQDLPYGRYVVTVWGNMKSEEPLSEDATQAEMEAVGAQANDIYLATDTIDYNYDTSFHKLSLHRTKGALVIEAEGLPENINYSVKDISNVYSVVTKDFEYGNVTQVRTHTDWENPTSIRTHTVLCPSEGEEASTLQVYFLDKSELSQTGFSRAGGSGQKSMIVPDDVNITLRRNELTVLRYVYREPGIEVYILVNDRWESAHGMIVD